MVFNELISVCMPVYNGALYIKDTLSSIIGQTYNNIEIIISDNASTDNTDEIILKMAENDKRIKYFRNTANIGYVRNITAAVSRAQSDIITIYHADDIYHPDIIRKEYDIYKLGRAKAVFSRHLIFSDDVRNAQKEKVYDHLDQNGILDIQDNCHYLDIKDFIKVVIQYGNVFACPSLMTSKAIYNSLGGFQDNYAFVEDLELWIKYLKAGYELAITKDYLLSYRRSPGQGSEASENSKTLHPLFDLLENSIMDDDGIIIDEIILKNYIVKKASGYKHAALNCIYQGDKSNALNNIMLCRSTYDAALFTYLGIFQKFPFLYAGIRKILK